MIVEIEPTLKVLKLSGILDSLSIRNREAIDNKLSFTEFLATLLQDEILRREQKKFDMRFKKAQINSNKTLEQFDFGFNAKINQQQIKDLVTCQFVAEKAPVLIVGPCGTGKSHVAQAIAHCAIRNAIDVLFFTQTQIFKYLQAARATGEYEKKFQQLIKIPLLIIDDFGLKPLRTPQDEDLHDLIAERYGKENVPDEPRIYRTKAKNAQEAHEAIRPTSAMRTPESIKSFLSPEQFKLYDLIWKRTVASQMISATIDTVLPVIALE